MLLQLLLLLLLLLMSMLLPLFINVVAAIAVADSADDAAFWLTARKFSDDVVSSKHVDKLS